MLKTIWRLESLFKDFALRVHEIFFSQILSQLAFSSYYVNKNFKSCRVGKCEYILKYNKGLTIVLRNIMLWGFFEVSK